MWDEFHSQASVLVPQSQERLDALFVSSTADTTEVIPGTGIRIRKRPPEGETETTSTTKHRRGQDYFRDIVLNNYDNRCAVTGLPVRELLIASHILPWHSHEAERLNVRNGICLNRLHDAAFDQGLIGFDDNLCLMLSTRLKSLLPHTAVAAQFEAYEGQSLTIPDDSIPPAEEFLAEHREQFKVA